MAVFLVTPLAQNFDALMDQAVAVFGVDKVFPLQANAGILISHKGATTIEISAQLGIHTTDQDKKSIVGSAIVTLVGSYFGRGPTDMWEWLKSRFEDQ